MNSNRDTANPPPPYSREGKVAEKINTISDIVGPKKHSFKADPIDEPKLPYPKAVFFIISNEFCERFSYYGMRTILALYLAYLGFSEDQSTMIYHVFVMLCYFTPLFGGIIADSYLGKYRTIFYVSLLYAFGNIVLSTGSVKSLNINHVVMSMIGLFLIGTGTGGIKPCVSSFGGDQFVLPQQQSKLERFFSVFYFSINAGSVISSFITPILRESVPCFGEDFCYPLAFGVPALLMCFSVVIFVCGRSLYKINPPSKENVAIKVVKCWSHAIARKFKNNDEKKHWIDYADDKYSLEFIEETKTVLRIIYLFAPTIVFWALYEQQGSRWTFQASHMDGDIGFYIVQPDQMQTVNAILCLLFIPLFESFIYPLLKFLRIVRTPLQKLCYGGLLAAVAFLLSGFVQLRIEASEPVLPTNGVGHLRLYNTLNCPITIDSPQLGIKGDIQIYDSISFTKLSVDKLKDFKLQAKYGSGCNDTSGVFNVQLDSQKISNYIFRRSDKISLDQLEISNGTTISKSKDGATKIQVIYGGSDQIHVKFLELLQSNSYDLNITNYKSEIKELKSYKTYSVIINGKSSNQTVQLKSGGVFHILIKDVNTATFNLLTITQPNSINMMWQLPQYVVITSAEIMFSITGLEFSFTQSPLSMKSVVASLWLLTDALGNVIILLIAGMKIFESQASEFFLFAGLMTFVMCIFIVLAMNYKYVDQSTTAKEVEIKKDDSRL